jgi:hypothetical protein
LQLQWVHKDERLPDWETARDVGAIEDWAGHWGPAGLGFTATLGQVAVGRSGEYPALYPALSGGAAYALGLSDWNGDGAAYLALLWAWLALLGTWGIGRSLGDEGTGLLAAFLLLCSPLYTALAREPLMECGMTALVALAAACGFAAVRDVKQRRRLGAWACLGLFAGAALLTKQTAVLALLPLGLVLLFINGSRWVGPVVAGSLCLAVCGPWYVQAFLSGDDYLLRSAQANPAALGPLRQLLFYPLALGQQAWPALVWALGAGLGIVSFRRGLSGRTGRWSIPLAVVLCGLLLLMGIPKKYPRLLLPLLPIAATLAALWLQRWPVTLRRSFLAVVLAGGLVSLWPMGPATTLLGAWDGGLREVDERCYQDWIRPADPTAFDWGLLIDLVEEAGGPGTAYRVGAVSWSAPPCAYQTTLHIGEHLQVRLRRAGTEATVETGGSWTVEEGWGAAPPEVLVSEGPLDCARLGAVCAQIKPPEEMGSLVFEHPDWNVALFVYRISPVAPASPKRPTSGSREADSGSDSAL